MASQASNNFQIDGKNYHIKHAGVYTVKYKKYIRDLVKGSNGEHKMIAEKSKIYDATVGSFVSKKTYLKANGGIREKYAREGYSVNAYGNIVNQEKTKEEIIAKRYPTRVKAEPMQEYLVLIKFEVRFTGSNDVLDFLNPSLNATVRFNALNKSQVIEKFIGEEKQRFIQMYIDSSDGVADIKVKKVWLNRIYTPEFNEVAQAPMFGSSIVNLSMPAIGVVHDGRESKDCVPHTILKHLNNPKATGKGRIKDLTIEKVIHLLRGGSIKDDIPKQNDLKSHLFDGFDTMQVMRVFTGYKIPCYAIDHRRKCFMTNNKQLGDDKSHHFKSFVYMTWNNHMYVVDDGDFKLSVYESAKDGINKKKVGAKTSSKEKPNEEDLAFTFFDGDSIEELKAFIERCDETMIHCTTEKNIVHELFYCEIAKGTVHDDPNGERHLKVVDNKIVRFMMHGIIVNHSPDHHLIVKVVEKLNVPIIASNGTAEASDRKKLYKVNNSTIPTLALEYYERNYGHVSSQLSPDGIEVMNSPLNTAFNEFWKDPATMDDMHAYDVKKHYSSILQHAELGWSVYSPMDSVKAYSGQLVEGFFFVKTDNYFPMRGNGWYNGECLIEYLADGIISEYDIKFEYIPSRKLGSDHFNAFVNDVYFKFFNVDEKLKASKDAVNKFIGLLRRSEAKKSTSYFFSDTDTLMRHWHSVKLMNFDLVTNAKDEVVAFHVMEHFKYPLTYTSTPIHRKVYDMSALNLWRIVKRVGGVDFLWGIRTDALFFDGGNRLEYDDKVIGGLKYQEIIKRSDIIKTSASGRDRYLYQRGIARNITWTLKERPWANCAQIMGPILTSGCVTTGDAGTGKTYSSLKLKEKLDELGIKYRTCTPTHKSSLLHDDGETIHHVFGLGIHQPVLNISALNALVKDEVKVIILDEISMIPQNIWGLFVQMKIQYGFKFFGFGDFKQIGPVGEEQEYPSYQDSDLLYDLFDGKRHQLLKNYRCINDPEFEKFYVQLMSARNDGVVDASKFGNKVCERAIAWTNKTCDHHNNKVIQRKILEQEHMAVGDSFVFVGMPLVATKTLQIKSCDSFMNSMIAVSKLAKDGKSNKDIEKEMKKHHVKEKEMISNNEQFEIVSYNAKEITIRTLDRREAKTFKIGYPMFASGFKPAFCLTIHKMQGSTLRHEFSIYEYNQMDASLLYTALSRSSDMKYVNLVSRKCIKGYIYMYLEKETSKPYIGSTINFSARQQQHLESQEMDKFHVALRDKGIAAFDLVILTTVMVAEQKDLRGLENYYINHYNSYEQGYNSKHEKKYVD